MVGDIMDKKNKTLINEDLMTRSMLERIRQKATLLKEDVNQEGQDAIAITNDPKFGQEVLKNQIEEFKATVDGGAQFASENTASPSDSPLVYMPSTGNLIFSGTIPALNNLKWQFSLKDSDGTGLFIWSEGLRLNKENLQVLNKLYGHYQNWKKEWEASAGMLENLGRKDE
jgi:hypothetical protein